MEKRITVFTPSYNRANLLHRCYESLLRQTNQQFKWLVIDDGSADNTRDIVTGWINEHKIEIEYYYKENGGLHTAYNAALERMDTELSVCIDSDDWMPDDAIETILTFWDANKSDDVAGIIGLDYTAEGKLIGNHLVEGELIYPQDLMTSKTNRGDKKYVLVTKLHQSVAPMPVFPGEKNFNPHYMVLKLSAKYSFLALDRPLCIVDYQEDGMSANIFQHYLNSPNSFAEYRRAIMELPNVPFPHLCRTVIHYVSSCIIAKQKGCIRNSPKKLLTVLLWPLGCLFSMYVRRNKNTLLQKNRKNEVDRNV